MVKACGLKTETTILIRHLGIEPERVGESSIVVNTVKRDQTSWWITSVDSTRTRSVKGLVICAGP